MWYPGVPAEGGGGGGLRCSFCSCTDKPHQIQTTCNTWGQYETRSCSHGVIWHPGLSHVPPAPAKTFSLVAVFIEKVKSRRGTYDHRPSVCPAVPSLRGGPDTPSVVQSQAGHPLPGARGPPGSSSLPPGWPSSSSPPLPAGTRGGGAAHNWVSSRVSGLQGPSLLLQLLLRLWPSLDTWASGSERIRYLRSRVWLSHRLPFWLPHSRRELDKS